MRTWKGRAGCVRSEQASCIRLVEEIEKEKEKNKENVSSMWIHLSYVSTVRR